MNRVVKLNLLTVLAIVVTFGTAIFISQLLIPVAQFRMENQDQEAFDQRFFGYGSSQTINVNFTQIALSSNDADSVERATQALASCEPAYFDFVYDQDRMIIAIDDDVQDESCSIAINLWAGGIYTSLDCLIPNEKVAAWDGWKNIGSPDVSQISEHCNEIRSFEVGEIVPAE